MSPGEPTYVRRRRRPLRLVERPQQHRQQLLLLELMLVVHGDHSVGHLSLVDAVRWNILCPPHPRNDDARLVRCDQRSTGHLPFRRRCATLRWTLLDRRRYRPTSDTSRVTILDMVSLLDCRFITIVVGVVVSVLLYVGVLLLVTRHDPCYAVTSTTTANPSDIL